MALTKINLVMLLTSSELSKFLILPFKIRKVRLYSTVTKWGNVLILYPLCSTPYWKSASLSALLPVLLPWHKPVSLFAVCCPVLLASWQQLVLAWKKCHSLMASNWKQTAIYCPHQKAWPGCYSHKCGNRVPKGAAGRGRMLGSSSTYCRFVFPPRCWFPFWFVPVLS